MGIFVSPVIPQMGSGYAIPAPHVRTLEFVSRGIPDAATRLSEQLIDEHWDSLRYRKSNPPAASRAFLAIVE